MTVSPLRNEARPTRDVDLIFLVACIIASNKNTGWPKTAEHRYRELSSRDSETVRPRLTVVISSPLRQLLIHCHTFCSVDCCRANAFQISTEMIRRWLEFDRVDRTTELLAEIGQVKALLSQQEGEVMLVARDLESTWPSNEFKTFWAQLEIAVVSAVGIE